ncbi:uncharacterized protein LOC113272597 [Papaver somniferum]|uniref:uncharacterized protein LOC113272597 n=1 Tax=Papaver somniferum TaxID=3469 RepID=UPI000E6F5BB6|nr:uncharacterized protein LOC113272597 [Papaver somniferum]
MPTQSADCTRCKDLSESIMHTLVLCPFASRVWFLSQFWVNTQFFSSKSFMDWMLFWLVNPVSKLPERDQCLFVAVLWSLCQSRNNLVFQDVKENHTAVLMRAKAMLLTRKSINTISTMIPTSISDRWMPPPTGWIKSNTYGAYDIVSGDNGAGYVMKDFTNNATFCASIVFHVQSAEEAEARAIWAGLKKVVEQKFTHLILESDA